MEAGPDPALGAYPAAVAAGLTRVLGPALIGVYLHGSGALGGWSPERSDVDLLGVVARPLERRAKKVISARLNHPSLACPAPAGLELSLVTVAVAADPPKRPPFELHLSTGPSPQTHLGGPAATDPDLLVHFAVCRRAGVAVAGPDPVSVFAEPPRAWLLERAAAELRWAVRHGTFAYRVLTACRAWRYLEDDVLGAKVESGRWARLRLASGPTGGATAPRLTGAPPRGFPTNRRTPPGSPGRRRRTPPRPPPAAAPPGRPAGLAPMPGAAADLAAADGFVAAVLERFRRGRAVEGRVEDEPHRSRFWMAVGVVAISTSPILIRVAAMPALALAFWRCLAGAAVLAPFAPRGQVGRLGRGDLVRLAASGCAWPRTSPSGTPPWA